MASVDTVQADHRPGEDLELGPDALLWQHAGHRSIYLMAPAAGVLQNMLPGVSTAIMEQSVFFEEPLERTMRSVSKIVQTIYDPQMAHTVRDYHRDLKGIDYHGQRFHALSPELYFAAHAVFTYTVMTAIDTFITPLDDIGRERLYGECKAWYRQYDVSQRCMPETWSDFEAYWDDLCRDHFESTPSVRRIIDELFAHPQRFRPRGTHPMAWRVMGPLVYSHSRLLTVALVPPIVREKLGLEYSRLDRFRFQAIVLAVRAASKMPDQATHTAASRRAKRGLQKSRE